MADISQVVYIGSEGHKWLAVDRVVLLEEDYTRLSRVIATLSIQSILVQSKHEV